MLDIKLVRERAEEVKANLKARQMEVDVDALLAADEQARAAKLALDTLRQRRNTIGRTMSTASAEQRAALAAEGRRLKQEQTVEERLYADALADRDALLRQLPNWSHPEVPVGRDDTDNRELREQKEHMRSFDFVPRDHVELMEALDLIDFEGGARVTGNKFYFLKNEAVLLEQALVRFACEKLRAEGFTLFQTPDLARREILDGIGFNPRGESTQIYNIADSDLSLVATAEITLGGLLAGQIIPAERLPLCYAGVSHCFRTEAGSAGRESRGLYRVHQFTKVEMFAFTTPEQSEAMHERILGIEEAIYQELNLPYRVMDICSGDLGAPAYRKYDIEAWMPGRNAWGEVTSASNCTDYQARRLNIRYRRAKGVDWVHMLNGTAIAASRAMLALIENGQQANGAIELPPCLGLARIDPK